MATVLYGCGTGLLQQSKPNIVLIMSDDQEEDSVRHMPTVREELVERGTSFSNFFVSTPLCCPSRATFLRGQYEHNHEVLDNTAPAGGYEKWRRMGHGDSTVATWLDDAGYDTALIGKYINEYGEDVEQIETNPAPPPGWDEWYARLAESEDRGETYLVNENGKVARYKHDQLWYEDYLADRAVKFTREREESSRPFFLYVATKAAKPGAGNAPRHDGMFVDEPLPRPPSFNEEDVTEKWGRVRRLSPLSSELQQQITEDYRQRLRSLQAVDELVADVFQTLRDTGKLDNTYVIYTSDNGWHQGEHRIPKGKGTPYEESISVPFVVRGPGVPIREAPHLVLNNDFAPTSADLASATLPNFVDGKSFAPLLSESPPDPQEWRRQVLIEHLDIGYRAVRTQDAVYVRSREGHRELYDLVDDPYQMASEHRSRPELVSRMEKKLEALKDCEGEECHRAEMAQ